MHINGQGVNCKLHKKDTRVSMEGVRRPDNPSDYKSEPDSYFPSTFLSQLFSLKRTQYSVTLVVIVSVSLFALHVLISYTIFTLLKLYIGQSMEITHSFCFCFLYFAKFLLCFEF